MDCHWVHFSKQPSLGHDTGIHWGYSGDQGENHWMVEIKKEQEEEKEAQKEITGRRTCWVEVRISTPLLLSFSIYLQVAF